jgi:ABC-type branched-subunit amino acid transport system substrate-binding protein
MRLGQQTDQARYFWEEQMKYNVTMVASALALMASGVIAEPLKVGVLATLEWTYTVLGEDGVRGLKTALTEANFTAGGREIEIIIASTDASPDSAVRAARKVVEQDGVDIVIGPLSGSEGIAIRDYAKTQPDITFLNGSSAAQETTCVTPAENFFRFNTDGAQWSVRLGDYIYNEKGYRSIATVGENYSFIYTQVFGGAIKKLLNNYTFLLPIHDRPAKIEKQKVVGRLGMTVPGPMTETLPDRPWFAA